MRREGGFRTISSALYLYFGKTKEKDSRTGTWRLSELKVQFCSAGERQRWEVLFGRIVGGSFCPMYSRPNLNFDYLFLPEFRRPRRLLVFLNPFGGKKLGKEIFEDEVGIVEVSADYGTKFLPVFRWPQSSTWLAFPLKSF